MIDLWKQCAGGPFGGRLLPCSGGAGDQPAALMDAFTIIGAILAEKDG